jgi:hypothetical protein
MTNIQPGDVIAGHTLLDNVHGPIAPMPGYVTIDGEDVYPCLMGMDTRTGDIQRWNGFVAFPLFDKATAERVVADVIRDNAPGYVEADRFLWEGDTLVQFSWDCEPQHGDEAYHYVRRLIEPTTLWSPDPRYCIGGYEWTWALANADEIEKAGFDPGLRDLSGEEGPDRGIDG